MWRDHLRAIGLREFEFDCACNVFPPTCEHRDPRLLEAGEPDHVVESITGHLSRRMFEHYSHIRLNAKKAAVDRLDAASKPAAGRSTEQAVTARRRGHGISWSERSCSCPIHWTEGFWAGNGPLRLSRTRHGAGRNIAIWSNWRLAAVRGDLCARGLDSGMDLSSAVTGSSI
jgi:hypothetical protein